MILSLFPQGGRGPLIIVREGHIWNMHNFILFNRFYGMGRVLQNGNEIYQTLKKLNVIKRLSVSNPDSNKLVLWHTVSESKL